MNPSVDSVKSYTFPELLYSIKEEGESESEGKSEVKDQDIYISLDDVSDYNTTGWQELSDVEENTTLTNFHRCITVFICSTISITLALIVYCFL